MAGMRHIIPISGKDSLAAALFQSVHEPRDYEYFYNDTGAELPETYDWLNFVEKQTGWKIKRIGCDLQEIIDGFDYLPSHNARYCTRMAKIEPMFKWIGDDDATVYYGLRADEKRVGLRATKKNIKARYPLMDNGLNINAVWSIVQAQNLLPPSFEWSNLRQMVEEKISINDMTFLQPWELHTLYSGRTRPNCFFCFYQRQYEYLWLYDTHPDLFQKACEAEDKHGGEGYTWREGYKLSDLIHRREIIMKRRADEILDILSKRRQGYMFSDYNLTDISSTSCGLMCGK